MCVSCLMLVLLSACSKVDSGEAVVLTPLPIESSETLGETDNESVVNGTSESSLSTGSPQTVIENNASQLEGNFNIDLDPYVGEYNDEAINSPNLEIQKNSDGTYTIQIGIFRLTKLYDCVGYALDDRIEFSTVEWGDDKKIGGTIRLEDDVAIVTFMEGWSNYSFGDVTEYKFHKTSNFPNVSVPTSNVNLNTYVGEYNDHDNNEPNLEIQQNDDGTYMIQIGVFRLIWLHDCIGYKTDKGIDFSTTLSGSEISGTITLEGNVATVTFTAGWSWYPSEYRYYKTSDIPNIYTLE